MLLLLPATLALLLLSSTAHADFAAGDRAARSGDFAAALTEWQPAAEAGDARSQYGLCWLHAEGRGVTADNARAAEWCRLAAEQGLAKAQYNYGLMLSQGRGVERDPEAAAGWYELAAKQGDSDARNNLGMAYAEGFGVPQDDILAFYWFSLADEHNENPIARANLGRLIARMPQERIDAARRKLGQSL